MILRFIESQMKEALWGGRTLILYGPRQVGKTTLVKSILAEQVKSGKRGKYFDAETLEAQQLFRHDTWERMKKELPEYDIIILDEAQKLENIGSLLKLIHDHIPTIQMIATGSSSFDLAQRTRESMVGRVREFFMTPITLREYRDTYGSFEARNHHELFLQYGWYPTLIRENFSHAEEYLSALAGGMLYKDILSIDGIRKPKAILDLLFLIALQIGKEVSYHELAQKLGMSTQTVQRYLYLLEESFIVFTLPGLSRNLRNEITKSPKIYFYDIGIRNALINNFNPPNLRTDTGELWENFIIAEMMKRKKTEKLYRSCYFWRTHTQQEIDYIEDYDGTLHAYEVKWNEKKIPKLPKIFAETYPMNIFQSINRENWIDMILG